MQSQPPKLLEQVRNVIRARHYSIRTEEAYTDWIKRFILFNGKRHPRETGKEEVEAFLAHLTAQRDVAASAQSQAKSAILFLYQQVLEIELPWLKDIVSAKQPQRLPTVLTINEVQTLLTHMSGLAGLIAQLLYGSGLRLMEARRLRVQDLDFGIAQLVVHNGKVQKTA